MEKRMAIVTEWGRFFQAPQSVFQMSISEHAKLVYLALCSTANAYNGKSWPSRETIAKMCSISIATTKRALRELSEAGIVQVEPREGDTNLYIIKAPRTSDEYMNSAESGSVGTPPGSDRTPPGSVGTPPGSDRTPPGSVGTPNNTKSIVRSILNNKTEADVVVKKYQEVTGRQDLSIEVATSWIERFGVDMVLDVIGSIRSYRRRIENPIGFIVVQLAGRARGEWTDPEADTKAYHHRLAARAREVKDMIERAKQSTVDPGAWLGDCRRALGL